MSRTRTFRLTAWLACLAMLVAALAPTLSRALAAQAGSDRLVMICTSTGVRFVDARQGGAEEPASPTRQAAAHDDCPYCTSAGHAPALPADSTGTRFSADLSLVRAREPALPALPPVPNSAPLARGPPALA